MKSNFKEFDLKMIRNVHADIHPLFLSRWSPRAFTGESISDQDVLATIEAGRLAFSSGNSQPWRIIYAHKNTPKWDVLFNLLVDLNQEWVKNAGVLFLLLSKTSTDKGRELPTCSFDTGAFAISMALEATNRNLPMHFMAGFDYEKARKDFKIPDLYKVEAMACMGVPGPLDTLSVKNQEREKPSARIEIDEIIYQH